MSYQSNQRLGAQVASAAASRKSLQNALSLSLSAISVMQEGLQRAETSLQTLSEIRIQTEALATKAHGGVTTSIELRREFADYTFNSADADKDHQSAMADAWKGRHSAMTGIIRAGKSQKAHEGVVTSLGQMKDEYRGNHDEKSVEGVRSAVETEGSEILRELLDAVEGNQETLRGALTRLNDHQKAWDWVEEEFKKASASARMAISGLKRRESGRST